MPHKILLLFAHPSIRRSRVNRALLDAASAVAGVTVHDLYETYPDFAIDVDREQRLLLDHDAIVCQHPLFWYSAPAIVREWQDLVLEHGWAYGRHGRALEGKTWMQAVSTGGREGAYREDGLNRYSIDELLRPFEATAHLCHMVWQRPFVVHATHVAEAAEIDAAADAFRARLVALRDGSPVRVVV
ncbi:NAD(P)H-dependent oxidoreductase [Oharaeibacter diazotrophicus]|uniref:Kef-type potassium/proton antiporter accessory protein (CPA2 family) n=1 Tax=Oharaeibacter diazotrophicus TaxID=1920512 RepID=A0A4R6RAV1_9HYPH|nr:NAD(P)H-dependent oxidoreductase [Oharaeibacter diazotrophicus]TDP82767.1 Kef-type potassium/proton antiporter accessory protein (CPA2 family) [Oharaeibacter diazotrophicus]BBE72471.1 general stress protein 14 [Pleomorphomonas sp. SM30]GLS76502.1 NAD(P)H oxidoreductase [Oharaeibacter diazotrophicus]